MKKMLCISTCFPSAEKPYYCVYILQQLKEVAKNGFAIDVLIPDDKLDQGVLKEETFDGFRIKRIGYTKRKLFKIFNVYNSRFFKTLRTVFEDNMYDIIQMDIVDVDLIAIVTKLKRYYKVCSYHVHGLNIWRNYKTNHKLFELFQTARKIAVCKKIDIFIGVSNKTSLVISQHIKNNKIHTVYNGVDPSLFYPKKARTDDNVFTIYCVANLIEIKGHRYLIEGFSKAKEKYCDTRMKLVIIGTGPVKEELLKQIDSLGIHNHVILLESLNYPELAEKFREDCDLFVMPSYYESLGCVYLEAMASDIIAVGVKGCGIDEIITDKQNGILLRGQNADDVYSSIDYVLSHKNESKTIAENGMNTVINRFTWAHSGKELARVYREELEKRNGRF